MVETGGFALAFRRAQGRVGDEEDALGEADVAPLAELRERHDITFAPAERHPVAPCILDELVTLGDPDSPAAALQPIVEDDARDLPPLSAAGAIAQKPALAQAEGTLIALRRYH